MLKKQFSKSKPTCKVTFSLPKEAVTKGKSVELVGEWNDWNEKKAVKMKAVKGDYTATVELETGRNYEFRYLVGKSKWENDWEADGYVPNPFGFDNSVLSIVSVPTVNKTDKKSTDKKSSKKASAKKTTAKKAAPKKAAAKVTRKVTRKPAAKKVTKSSTKDDLKKIEGIGPKIAEHLNKGGIHTFADLGKAKQSTLKEILAAAGPRYKMHNPGSWPKQSKLAAKGNWNELKALQDKLNGGK